MSGSSSSSYRRPAQSRRRFLRTAGGGAGALCTGALGAGAIQAGMAAPEPPFCMGCGTDRRPPIDTNLIDTARPVRSGRPGGFAVRPARWYDELDDGMVRCRLCPRECVVADVERGYCGVRENRGGEYVTLVYGSVCSFAIDPIEKKPLYHYLPGTNALSLATAGCNMECLFCQNWEISQVRPEQVESIELLPERIVETARAQQCPTIAYTYSEPVIFYEYMYDTAELGRERGVGSVMISNGYIHEEPLREVCRQLTGVKIDLKAFTEEFYTEWCAGELAPVLETLEVLIDIGIHTEIVVLLIPTLNDSVEEIGAMARWIVEHLGSDVPLQFSRFHPIYRLQNLPPTPVATLERARTTALETGVNYVYIGNVPMHEGSHTYCPSCGRVVIRRVGYSTDASGLVDGRCAGCGRAIPGIWTQEQALASRG